MLRIREVIAKELSLSVEEVMRLSLKAFFEREIRAAQMDIADLQDRYGVRDSAELRARIERGEIYSHPAWEESIEWERLENYIARLRRLADEVSNV